ncbi:MAG: hypothetical protein UV39_C0011G0016, partial [Candidatus Azambacteria bacterium GW2011_GWA2_42_62]
KLDERAYKNAILYFIKYCNNKYLHATKLNKLLYYLDFVYFRDHKKSITGDVYIHQGYGPVPSRVDEMLAKLKNEGAIDTEAIPHNDVEMINFSLKDETKFNESIFPADHKKLLKQICDELGSWPTEKIVAQTHLEAPWFYSKPYEIVDCDVSPRVREAIQSWAPSVSNKYETSRSKLVYRSLDNRYEAWAAGVPIY